GHVRGAHHSAVQVRRRLLSQGHRDGVLSRGQSEPVLGRRMPRGARQHDVARLLAHRSELKSEACRAPQGTGSFMQLTDFDTMAGISRTGFARYEPDL